MALDILVTGLQNDVERKLPLYLDEYDYIISQIEGDNRFSLLKRIFSDYYGEDEVYLNDLESLRLEILAFDKKFNSYQSPTVAEFIVNFLEIVDYSIEKRKTIKIIGD